MVNEWMDSVRKMVEVDKSSLNEQETDAGTCTCMLRHKWEIIFFGYKLFHACVKLRSRTICQCDFPHTVCLLSKGLEQLSSSSSQNAANGNVN